MPDSDSEEFQEFFVWLGIPIPEGEFGELFLNALRVFRAFEWEVRSERLQVEVQARKRIGRQWCSNAPYGFRWARRRDGTKWLAPAPKERGIMRVIVELRRRNYPWRDVVEFLRQNRLKARRGRSLTLDQVRRMARAESKLTCLQGILG